MRAWYRGDAAAGDAERIQARQEAEEYSALAQEVGAYREALTEVAEVRRRWHAATELSRQQAIAADTELRRRYPGIELPPLHLAEDPSLPERGADSARNESDSGRADALPGAAANLPEPAHLDVKAALAAARAAEEILAERERKADRDADLAGDDLMRRREAETVEEAAARHSAVRQDPAPSRRTMALEREEPELEAGY